MMSELKRIAIVGTTADSILNFRKELIVSLVALGYEVFAFATDYKALDRVRVREIGAEPVDYILSRTGLNPVRDLLDMLKLVKIFKHLKPDLVFSYFSKPVIFSTLAARLAGVKTRVGMLEGLGFSFTLQPQGVSLKAAFIRNVQVLLYRLTFPFLDRMVFLNEDDYKDLVVLRKIRVKKYCILGGIGLDLARYPLSIVPTSPVRFIFVGRFLIEKGIREYLAACEMLKAQYPHVECVIIGAIDSNSPGFIGEEIERLVKKGVILCPGHVANVSDWLASSSVFILPSYREGFPRSTQEAMAIGRAVITTDVPGCKDTVFDGINGFLIPPWSADAILKKMIVFVENVDLAISMGRESHRIAQRDFSSVVVNRKLISFVVGDL
ncbi:Glycosyltransferase involved in cell wall bisynthesis [Pseudomonas seleniipraecipitans]|uniref:Glycosyltransferase involved in cell wall bisynthesis n=2 Tax=Phytopseudomonas seleniipraecipitans TaxID=640205 RepID=A0A1G7V0Z8_9GAMM|nr:Glycosyltransferase involved in cell wall bisynthesis [Pseudomonas seleniipraecipitans]